MKAILLALLTNLEFQVTSHLIPQESSTFEVASRENAAFDKKLDSSEPKKHVNIDNPEDSSRFFLRLLLPADNRGVGTQKQQGTNSSKAYSLENYEVPERHLGETTPGSSQPRKRLLHGTALKAQVSTTGFSEREPRLSALRASPRALSTPSEAPQTQENTDAGKGDPAPIIDDKKTEVAQSSSTSTENNAQPLEPPKDPNSLKDSTDPAKAPASTEPVPPINQNGKSADEAGDKSAADPKLSQKTQSAETADEKNKVETQKNPTPNSKATLQDSSSPSGEKDTGDSKKDAPSQPPSDQVTQDAAKVPAAGSTPPPPKVDENLKKVAENFNFAAEKPVKEDPKVHGSFNKVARQGAGPSDAISTLKKAEPIRRPGMPEKNS